MVQYYYRDTGKASAIMGPFETIEEARMNALVAGLKPRKLNFLMKNGPHMVRIDSTIPDAGGHPAAKVQAGR